MSHLKDQLKQHTYFDCFYHNNCNTHGLHFAVLQAIYDLKVDKRVNKIGDGSKLEKYHVGTHIYKLKMKRVPSI